jgi:glycosyltransferase involved in cell wall biosynthesis
MFDQLVVGAAPGDAITRNAMLIRSVLQQFGPSEVYAQYREGEMADICRPLEALASRPNRSRPLVFHASMGSWNVHQALIANEPRLILVYHNFSPAEHYVAYDTDVADDLIRGRWELEALRGRVELAIAVSDFNADELRELGYEDVTVVPPTPDAGRLAGVTPDIDMMRRISSWGPGPLVLCVAQLLPHKRIERVLAAVAVLQQEFQPNARLAVVGVERFPAYSAALRAMARTVGLRDAHLVGRITDAELSALFTRAELFVTLSEHEGFCVPAIEAMALGVPVVASARAAIPATVGDAGVLIDDPDDPVLVAGVLNEVMTNPTLRHVLIGRGASRSRCLSAGESLPVMVSAILSAAEPTTPLERV